MQAPVPADVMLIALTPGGLHQKWSHLFEHLTTSTATLRQARSRSLGNGSRK